MESEMKLGGRYWAVLGGLPFEASRSSLIPFCEKLTSLPASILDQKQSEARQWARSGVVNRPTAENRGLQGVELIHPRVHLSYRHACPGGGAALRSSTRNWAFPASLAEQCLVVHTLRFLSPGPHPTGLSISGPWADGAAAVLVPSFLPGSMGSGDHSRALGQDSQWSRMWAPAPSPAPAAKHLVQGGTRRWLKWVFTFKGGTRGTLRYLIIAIW